MDKSTETQVDTIMNINPDVIVLLEFIEFANGYMDIRYCLTQLDFNIYTTKYDKGANGVLIAIKKDYSSEFVKEDKEYLEVSINFSENSFFSVIGMRILTQGEYTKYLKRRELLDLRLTDIKNDEKSFILLFDANNGAIQYESDKNFIYSKGERKDYSYQYIWRNVEDDYHWSLITPDKGGPYINGKYSIVTGKNYPENYHTKEDHIISSFSEELFSQVDYYWNFVNESNGYGKRGPKDYISDLKGVPDHAVLIAEIDIDSND